MINPFAIALTRAQVCRAASLAGRVDVLERLETLPGPRDSEAHLACLRWAARTLGVATPHIPTGIAYPGIG